MRCPVPFGQSELAADEVVLRFLGGLERLDSRGEPGAGVGHGGPEDHGVEVVADVVMVLHRLGVSAARVQPTPRCRLLRWRGERPSDDPETARRLQRLPGHSGPHMDAVRGRGVQRRQKLEDVALEGEVPHDEGAGQAELAG